MLSKKMKSILAIALCGIMTVVAIPMLPAKADDTGTTVCTDCAECTDYKMTEAKAYPEATKWTGTRDILDTDDGLQVTYPNAGNYGVYSTRTTAPVALDGAHMKLTTEGNARFIVVINNGGTGYNDIDNGLKIRIEKWSSKVTCLIDNVEVVAQHVLANPITDVDTKELFIKTTITDNGDLNIAINQNNIVIEKAKWESTYMNVNSSYFLVSNNDGNGYAFTYTWNYIHGGTDVCYSGVAAAKSLIENMQTGEEIVAARKAYLALSDVEKQLLENADKIEATLGQLTDSDFDNKMTTANAYPEATKWPGIRDIVDTEDGLKVEYYARGNYEVYSTRTTTPVALDGAQMKLTTSGNARFIVVINNGGTSYNDVTSGLKIWIEKWTSTVKCYIDGVEVVSQTLTDTITDADTKELLIKTTVTDNGDLNIALNKNNIVIEKAKWESTYMNVDSSYFLVSNSDNGYAFTYTWNYILGGDAVSYDALSDAETKIELCHPTTPIKAYVEAARNAYDSLPDELKAIVLNYDKLTTAEPKVKQTDFCNYGITEGNFLSSANWAQFITQTQTSSGYNIDFHWGTLGPAYRVRTSTGIQLHGAHIGVTMEHTGYDYCLLTLSNNNGNDVAGDVYLTLDTRNKTAVGHGNKYYLGFGDPVQGPFSNASTVGLPNNYDNSSVNFPDISDNNEMDIRFYVDAAKNLYVTVNGRYIVLTAEQLATINFDVTKDVYVGFSTTSGRKPIITVNYIVSGEATSYDEVTGDTNGDDTMNVLDLARMKNNEEKDIKDIQYYRTSSDLDKDGNSCDAEDLDLLRKGLVK